MSDEGAAKLIEQCLQNPAKFIKAGSSYQLLNEFFDAADITKLQVLLTHVDYEVRKDAIWVLAELGDAGVPLLKVAVSLLPKADRFVHCYVLEVIAVCTVDGSYTNYIHVIEALENQDEVIQKLAMNLITNANINQLQVCLQYFQRHMGHTTGLEQLIDYENLEKDMVISLLNSPETLLRKYGAIIAKKLFHKHPEFLNLALGGDDSTIRLFAKEALEDFEED